jgi:hypothetical protein
MRPTKLTAHACNPGKTRPNKIIMIDEITVSSIVPMVMGSRQTRTLSHPKKAAAVTMMLTSASVVMALI